MQIAYTTYSTPVWSPERIAERAAALGFDAIELRTYDGHPVPVDLSTAQVEALRRTFAARGLAVCAMGTSCRFAPSDEVCQTAVRDARRYLQVAAGLGAPLLRVFGGAFDGQGVPEAEAVQRVAGALAELAPAARAAGVCVVLETHDGFAGGARVGRVLEQVPDDWIAACWDWLHPCRVGETPAQTAAALRGRIRHAHTKDARLVADGKWQATPFGEGTLPLGGILQEMLHQGYDGPLSLEWEGPRDQDPEPVLAAYVPAIRRLLAAHASA